VDRFINVSGKRISFAGARSSSSKLFSSGNRRRRDRGPHGLPFLNELPKHKNNKLNLSNTESAKNYKENYQDFGDW
jgi:hypothetical protein